ncbi:DUF6296 family protein [Kitasatospora sp. NBC_01539]|uniref:DUF6296 family protein n=1 Tax=Kitasatospora sp. NBC_01539 TaxID=2903577 RepID=UPI00386022EB
MLLFTRYLVTFPGSLCGHAPQQRLIVTSTGTLGPGGHPVYADETGRLRLEITARGIAHLLTPAVDALEPPGPLHAEPLR